MGKTYEMLWDCEFCDSKKLLGKTHRHCPSCGAAQDPNKRYFPEESEKIAVEDHEYMGKDKICPSCDAPNSAKASCCTNCGSPLDGSKEVTLKEASPIEGESKQPKTDAPPKKSKLPLILGALAVLIVILIAVFSMTSEKEGSVIGHTWERTVDLERYQTVQEEDWKDQVPVKGYVQSCRDKERSTKKVEDGQECSMQKKDNGDGTFQENEVCKTKYKNVPIYDQWCSYRIDKWKKFDSLQKKGENLKPEWPNINIRACKIEALNCEREGAKQEHYWVHIKDADGNKHKCDFAQDKWKSLQKGFSKKMRFGSITGNIDCDSIFEKSK